MTHPCQLISMQHAALALEHSSTSHPQFINGHVSCAMLQENVEVLKKGHEGRLKSCGLAVVTLKPDTDVDKVRRQALAHSNT